MDILAVEMCVSSLGQSDWFLKGYYSSVSKHFSFRGGNLFCICPTQRLNSNWSLNICQNV